MATTGRGGLSLLPVGGEGPEDVAVLGDRLITGVADGRVLSMTRDGSGIELLADTGGRPLGIEALPDGRLLVCDAQRGLLRVDPDAGSIEPLVTAIGGRPMKLCDNASVGADGTIYFTDSSTRHQLTEYQADVIEGIATGRLLRRHPSGDVEVMLDGLQFANGVALADDESFVAVAETGAARILRVWLTGSRSGQCDVLADRLPGLPDNLSTGSAGRIWAALPMPQIAALRVVQRSPPSMRRLAGRLACAMRRPPPAKSYVLAIDRAGRTVTRMEFGRRCGYRMVTGVREHAGSLYLGSLVEHAIGAVSVLPPDRSTTPANKEVTWHAK